MITGFPAPEDTLFRSLTGTPRDVALLVGRVVLGYIILMHCLKKVGAGLFTTAAVFQNFGIPLAIAAASFTIVVEVVVTVSLVLGYRMVIPAGLMTFVMCGAIFFVHGKNGLFMDNKGWALVGVIICGLLFVAAAGPGRFSLDAWLDRIAERKAARQDGRHRRVLAV
ncbi:DoxX family protein [Pseudonocardia phyllosphaerae]|uniref:DoxX family protein n=1 Tax=Pseudonocardia phyllosphaerae TaxID=3390502 RepID=UPI00397C1585